MKRLTLWSPNTGAVELVDTTGHRFPMHKGPIEWEVDVDDNVAAAGYKFSIDGNDPIPDPRSRQQPNGVHGYSVVPPSKFEWTDATWKGVDLASSVLYELHVGTFSADGTFSGILEHLDHLVRLGINAIELMPIAEFAGSRGWGYDGVDLWAPHHNYGSPDEFRQLVNESHHRGIGVFLDVVYNHLGPEGNHLQSAGPYFTAQHTTPWGGAINYDSEHNDGVRKFVLDNTAMWLTEFHLDGLRLDATHAIVDNSPSHIVRDIVSQADAISSERGWPAWITVESDLNDPVTVSQRTESGIGWGAHAQWNDDFHHSLHVAITGEQTGYYADYEGLDDLVRVLNDNFALVNRWSQHRQKLVGKPANHLPHDKFIAFIQNHDHVGNRALGERLDRLAPFSMFRLAAAINILGPFVPLLFQGEEWGASTPFLFFTDYQDLAIAQAVRDGRRREFETVAGVDEVPDPQDEQSFLDSKLNWNEVEHSEHLDLLHWYKELIALRRNHAEFREGPTRATGTTRVLLMWRGSYVVATNFDTNNTACNVQIEEVVMSHGNVQIDTHKLTLGPHAIVIASAK